MSHFPPKSPAGSNLGVISDKHVISEVQNYLWVNKKTFISNDNIIIIIVPPPQMNKNRLLDYCILLYLK